MTERWKVPVALCIGWSIGWVGVSTTIAALTLTAFVLLLVHGVWVNRHRWLVDRHTFDDIESRHQVARALEGDT